MNFEIDAEALFARYQQLQQYVGWTDEDAGRVRQSASLVEPVFTALVDDFYAEIDRHPQARRVITGGREQVERLKRTLRCWLAELFSGQYDRHYVVRRWRVGLRHVEIGLDQVYTNVALARLRIGLLAALESHHPVNRQESLATRASLNKLLDLDLAIIEDAYQSEFIAREQLAQQLRLLAPAVRDVKEGILITDALLEKPGPRIIFVNQALTQITGYAPEELLGQTPRLFQSPRTDRAVLDRIKDQLLEGKAFTGELINRRKDGTEYYVELHVSPVFDSGGRITSYVSTQRDVTARKRSEDRVLQAERLAAIGEMVTGLAHESRNALQRSKTCLEMLALEVADRPEALDLVSRIHRAQDHLHYLYEEVRSYAAPLKMRRQRVNLAELWRDTWSQLEALRERRETNIREEIANVDLSIEADAFALGQVFRNILENAIVACPDPCEIVIGCMPVQLDGRPAIQVSVLDNGPGLSVEQSQRIFDPFFTTKTKGTGLGMAIAKRIVEAHGGTIAVGQRVGRGAEILVTLPREWHETAAAHRDR